MKLLAAIKKAFSASVMGSLLFALGLWAYTSLNGTYVTVVQVPVGIRLPEDRALETMLPQYISVEARGTGWNLFNLIFFNSTKKCIIDLSRKIINDSLYTISKSDLLNGIQAFEKVDAKEIYPEVIPIKTGIVHEKEIPIVPNILITPREGFMTVGDLSIFPDKVLIRGNNKVLDRINSWSTDLYTFKDVNKPFNVPVQLKDAPGMNVRLSGSSVMLSANIEQRAELMFIDVPVSISGSSMPKNHYISPRFITVVVRGGIEELSALEKSDIIVSVNYDDLVRDSSGIVIPQVDVPKNIKVISKEPAFLFHVNKYVVNKISDIDKGY